MICCFSEDSSSFNSINWNKLKKLKILDISSSYGVSIDQISSKLPESLELLFEVGYNNSMDVGMGMGMQKAKKQLKIEGHPNLNMIVSEDLLKFINKDSEEDLLELLTSYKSIIKYPNTKYYGETMLQIAIKNDCSVQIIQTLLDLKCDPNLGATSMRKGNGLYGEDPFRPGSVYDYQEDGFYKSTYKIVDPFFPNYPNRNLTKSNTFVTNTSIGIFFFFFLLFIKYFCRWLE